MQDFFHQPYHLNQTNFWTLLRCRKALGLLSKLFVCPSKGARVCAGEEMFGLHIWSSATDWGFFWKMVRFCLILVGLGKEWWFWNLRIFTCLWRLQPQPPNGDHFKARGIRPKKNYGMTRIRRLAQSTRSQTSLDLHSLFGKLMSFDSGFWLWPPGSYSGLW